MIRSPVTTLHLSATSPKHSRRFILATSKAYVIESKTRLTFLLFSFAAFTPRAFPDRVIIQYPAFVDSLASILNETDEDVLEAYLVTRAALALSPYLGTSTDAWLAQRSLYEALNGIKKGVVGNRAEYCLGQVENTLGYAAGRFFVKETFGGDSKEKGTKVITGKRERFSDRVRLVS